MRWKLVPCGVFALCTVLCPVGLSGAHADTDFGVTIEHLLNASAMRLFGVQGPLQDSALGPFTDADNAQALEVAQGLTVSVVSNVTDRLADMIAPWPNDVQPTHLFVCVENSFDGDSDPDVISVQRVDLNGDPDHNVETIVKGLSACDPIRRTPWGTVIVAEEAGATGGVYEILDPLALSGANPVIILSRATGTTSDPQHVVKRQAVGSLSFEGIVIRRQDGTMYFGDELRPSQGQPGGGIYKFVPDTPYDPNVGMITEPTQSPFASGTLYGLRLVLLCHFPGSD